MTVTKLLEKKQKGQKISMITAYDYQTATLVDSAGLDIILVGDSLGNVVLGYEDTTKVTMQDMLHHTRAVAHGTKNALIVGDMPFMSYHIGTKTAVKNAGEFIKAGANAVKVEGCDGIEKEIKAILSAGIPVMGHLGLLPQSVNKTGGYKMQGNDEKSAEKIIKDAQNLEKLGVFALVLECIPSELASRIAQMLSIPVIGIGAGKNTDGQVLVINDMLGFNSGYIPAFVKKYANVKDIIFKALTDYKNDVESGEF